MTDIRFAATEQTRVFAVNGVDRTLCLHHAKAREAAGDQLGVPTRAMAYMMGMLPWPTGEEPCDDCATPATE